MLCISMAILVNPNLFEIPSPLLPPPPPPPPADKSDHLPMLYYGLIVVGTAAFVLALYNLIVIKWCSSSNNSSRSRGGQRRESQLFDPRSGRSLESLNLGVASSFKYSKEAGVAAGQGEQQQQQQAAAAAAGGYECAVCLSVFEEGEDVRTLPKCNHSFHAPCIDMWLYSHSDCPLCRARVELAVVHRQAPAVTRPENRRVESV